MKLDDRRRGFEYVTELDGIKLLKKRNYYGFYCPRFFFLVLFFGVPKNDNISLFSS